MKRGKWHMIFWEIVLLLGSIPVFRSVWALCDRVDFLNQHAGLLLSFVLGFALCVAALWALNDKGADPKPDEPTRRSDTAPPA